MEALEMVKRLDDMAESMRRISAALGLDNMSDAERAAAAVTTSFMVSGLEEAAEWITEAVMPRVLTLDEMQTVDGIGFVEYKDHVLDKYTIMDGVFDSLIFKIRDADTVRIVDFEAVPEFAALADYGKTWRVWNRNPTETQRMETPWTRE